VGDGAVSGGPVPKSPAAPSALAPPVEAPADAGIWADLPPSRAPEAGPPVEAEQAATKSPWKHAAKLALSLQKRFDEAMLQSLCSDLKVHFANLDGDDLESKEIALVDRFQERDELDILEDAISRAIRLRDLRETLPSAPERTMMLFISYSHEDRKLRQKFQADLKMLKANGLINDWYDGKIPAGSEFDSEIKEYLDKADVILLLVSRDFLASDYIREIELPIAMERHEKGEARVIPILIKPAPVDEPPWCHSIGKLQMLPRNRLPIIKWKTRDDAFLEIYTNVRAVLTELLRAAHDDAASDARARSDAASEVQE
jgi:TIR domain